MAGDIRIQGLREARRNLARFGDEAKADLKRLNLSAAEDVRDTAKRLVPKRSGRLEATIRASGTLSNGRVRAGFARVPYAGPIHFGWSTRPRRPWGTPGRVGGGPIAPNPFLYDALDQRRSNVIRAYQKQLDKLAKKYSA